MGLRDLGQGLLTGLSVARLFVDSVVMGCSAFWYGDFGEIGPTLYEREEESPNGPNNFL